MIRRHAEQPADVVCWMGSAAVGLHLVVFGSLS
jgi:hypothetical protein